ncbi:sensor histidine kinase [Thermodesulfobacteriota bacterium]
MNKAAEELFEIEKHSDVPKYDPVLDHKMETARTLLEGITRDFSKLLELILNYTDMALANTDPDSAKEQLKIAKIAGQRAQQLLQKSHVFTPPANRNSSVRLDLLIENTINDQRPTIPPTIDVNINIAPFSDYTIQADPDMIRKVLTNLISNSVHSMNGEDGNLEISLTPTDVDTTQPMIHRDLQPGRYIQIITSDTGNGMASREILQAFDPYFSTRKFCFSRGWGLTEVYGIIQSLNGNIRIESQPEKGTQIIILLPCKGNCHERN